MALATESTQTVEELLAEIKRLEQEAVALRSSRGRGHSLKVSEKGGISLYGIGRFPLTLYSEQWDVVIGMCETGALQAFKREHSAELTRKIKTD